ncbi:MAG: hypothetical protein R6W77_03630 [Trueperaceae bacterium]
MTPLVLLLLLAFLMVIAASLMIWAALTLGDARDRAIRSAATEAVANGKAATRPSAPESERRSSAKGAVQAERERQGFTPDVASEAVQDEPPTPPPRPSNDEVRGARAVVTPRTPTDDAFERFLESETKDRGFPPVRPDDRRDR